MIASMARAVRGAYVVSLLAVSAVQAANVCTWIGGTDAQWSTSANWLNGTMPSNGDTVIISNTVPGSVLNNDLVSQLGLIKFPAGAKPCTLTGWQVTLTGYCDNPSTSSCNIWDESTEGLMELACGFKMTGGRGVLLSPGTELLISGSIQDANVGTTRMTVNTTDGSNNATLRLTGVNPFSWATYAWKVHHGHVIAGPGSLGATGALASFVNGASLTLTPGEHPNNFELSGGGTLNFTGTVTVAGTAAHIGSSTLTLAAEPGAQVHFRRPFEAPSMKFNLGAEADMHFDQTLSCSLPDDVNDHTRNGRVHLHGAFYVSNTFYVRDVNYVCEAPNVLPANKPITWRYVPYETSGTVDLNGYDQKVAGLTMSGTDIPGRVRILKSTTPARLTLANAADQTVMNMIEGPVSLVLDASSGVVQTFRKTAYALTGEIVVSNGVFAVAEGASFPNVGIVRVASGGVLRLSGGRLNPFASPVEIRLAAGATIDLPDAGTWSFMDTAIYLEGAETPLANGTYDATASWLTGTGAMTVKACFARWKAAADGLWSRGANWDAAVAPVADDRVFIDRTGADYTVSVDAPTAALRALYVTNDPGHVTTVSVANALNLDHARLALDAGAVLDVATGGFLNYVSPAPASASGTQPLKVSVGAGAELKVSGGTFAMSNFVGRTIVDGEPDNPARITVTGGTFAFTSATSSESKLYLGSNGVFSATGGLVTFDAVNASSEYVPLQMEGGTLNFSGTVTNQLGRMRGIAFGSGTATYSGDALLTIDLSAHLTYPQLHVAPTAEGETALLAFRDRARLLPPYYTTLERIVVGGNRLAPNGSYVRGLARLDYSSTGTSRVGTLIQVGGDHCRGEFLMHAGSFSVWYQGLQVGAGVSDSCPNATSEGYLKIDGGTIETHSYAAEQKRNEFCGLVVGSGRRAKTGAPGRYHGRVDIAGGRLSVADELTVVGACGGTGEIVQTGGVFWHAGLKGKQGDECPKNSPVLIGFGGGTGLYALSNGVATVDGDLFVGGAPTNAPTLAFCPANYAENARGELRVAGGTLNVSSNLVLSADGVGTLAFHAANASFQPITVGRSLVVHPGSRLRIDVSDHPSVSGRIPLLVCAAMEGAFAPENVELVFDETRQKCVKLASGPKGLTVEMLVGTCIILR